MQSPNLQNAVNLRLVLICHDLDLLGRELFGVEQDDTRFHHLLEIVEKSVKLGHTCAAQHSRLGFHMPHCKVDQGMLFDPKLMENVSSAEMIETCDMMVKFPVFPCLYKYDCNSDSQDVRPRQSTRTLSDTEILCSRLSSSRKRRSIATRIRPTGTERVQFEFALQYDDRQGSCNANPGT